MIRAVTHLVTAVALVAVAAPALAAQGHPLAGRWQVDYERGRRIENDEVMAIRGTATLTLELRGDSLVGMFVRPATPEQPAPEPQRFAARPTATGAVFVVKTTVTMNMNGEESTHEAVMTWTLDARGDAMEGTMIRTVTGMDFPVEPTPVKGTRLKE